MYDQYRTSELSDQDLRPFLWSDLCLQTAQWLLSKRADKEHMSAWDSLVYHYSDKSKPPRWQILKPSMRLPRQVIAGPYALPTALPDWPTITLEFSAKSGAHRQLMVLSSAGQPAVNANVALLKADGHTYIVQGETDDKGHVEVYGAEPGDVIYATDYKNALAGTVVVGAEGVLAITLAPLSQNTEPG
jgi:hypothetical protein